MFKNLVILLTRWCSNTFENSSWAPVRQSWFWWTVQFCQVTSWSYSITEHHLLSYITSWLCAACNVTSLWKQLQVQCTSMLHKMALDSMHNGEVAAVHHPIGAEKKKKLWYAFLSGDCRTTSKWPQVPLLSQKTTSHFWEREKRISFHN